MERKNIGGVIVSYLEHTNYGSSLQAYATLKVVRDLGYDFTFIKYIKQRNFFDWLKIAPGLILSGGLELIENRIKFKINSLRHHEYNVGQQVRRLKAREFKEKEFVPYYKEYIGYTSLCKGSKDYDVVFVGSDQVWRPFGFYSNYWNLMFCDDSVPKFSYAASFGVSKIPYVQIKGTKRFLERLDMISVREQAGKEIIESISSKKAQVVADPTMLLTQDDWIDFSKQSTYSIPSEPYIFCYFLGSRSDIRYQAKKLANETGMKIVIMRHMDEYVTSDETIGDYAPYDVNPYDFVTLLKNAEFVCTDSFHGTVFSIIMHRKFCTFYRVQPTSENSTHSRIVSLLDKFGLENRLFQGDILAIRENIDYSLVDEKLLTFREESLRFFQTALALAK